MVKTLEQNSFVTLQAENGRIGLATWEQNADGIDLVLSDVFMPGNGQHDDGARAPARSKQLPIILMSSELDEDSRWIAEEAGFRLLPKLFRDAVPLEVVARLLRSSTPP